MDDRVKELAIVLHDTYEKLSKEIGWKPQECCQTPWETLPTKNQEVMLGLAQAILPAVYIKKDEAKLPGRRELAMRIYNRTSLDLPLCYDAVDVLIEEGFIKVDLTI